MLKIVKYIGVFYSTMFCTLLFSFEELNLNNNAEKPSKSKVGEILEPAGDVFELDYPPKQYIDSSTSSTSENRSKLGFTPPKGTYGFGLSLGVSQFADLETELSWTHMLFDKYIALVVSAHYEQGEFEPQSDEPIEFRSYGPSASVRALGKNSTNMTPWVQTGLSTYKMEAYFNDQSHDSSQLTVAQIAIGITLQFSKWLAMDISRERSAFFDEGIEYQPGLYLSDNKKFITSVTARASF